jgi:aconitate hydratase
VKHNLYNSLRDLKNTGKGGESRYYSLAALEEEGLGNISRLPVSIRIVLESVLRNYDGKKVTEEHVKNLASWQPGAKRTEEIPFVVARIVLQDFTGVPLLCDLAAMRSAASRMGKDASIIEPLVPVDLVVDHSVQVDCYGEADALSKNMQMEFNRNAERYQFLKWGMGAFDTFKVIPPGIGIIHQVNLEYLARGVHETDGVFYPDTLVGTDSHTTMINGIGVVGWGVGGIEAEAGMLGQPVYFLTPDVVGVNLKGKLKEGITATDLVLRVTEMLRAEGVVGTFVEFFGEGTESLTLPDRATIANMAPEYGATMGFFPVDDKTVEYFKQSGRTDEEISAFSEYFKTQNMYGIPKEGDIDYTKSLDLDLGSIVPAVSGPKRPQDWIALKEFKYKFEESFKAPVSECGFAQKPEVLSKRFDTRDGRTIGSGDVVVAAITSCTNTSNPSVLIAAGLLAKKAVEKGLKVGEQVKTSLAPGSRVVTDYLSKSGLLPYLEKLGFYTAAYGCTTCIGNTGPLDEQLEKTIVDENLVAVAVLSGNRNFEARIHPNIKANYLMSPPLVVAYAIAGHVCLNMDTEPLGTGSDGKPVFLKDIWPSNKEVEELLASATDPDTFRRLYSDFTKDNELWASIPSASSEAYDWPASTYIAEPPFFKDFKAAPDKVPDIKGARALGIFGDSVTTDHISPAGPIKVSSAAGEYLLSEGVKKEDFQSYGTRRGNHDVMIRGTFANVRIRNFMLPLLEDGSRKEGGYTLLQPSGEEMFIYDAASKYIEAGIPSVVFGGTEYGTGSSRDWAAKGTQQLGVKAVVAGSYERIHRSNLVGMGVLPLQFKDGDSVQSLGIKGNEEFDIAGLDSLKPQQDVKMVIRRADGGEQEVTLLCRIDTPIEVDYFNHGGILPFVLRGLVSG